MNSFVIAQIFGVLSIIVSVLSMQLKDRENILLSLFLINLFSAFYFVFLRSFSGAYVCLFADLEILINSFFESKKMNTPIFVIVIYVIITIFLGMFTYKSMIDLLPIFCSLLYCCSIIVKEESDIRKLTLIKQIVWFVFEIKINAYLFSFFSIIIIISILFAIYKYDYAHVYNNG